MSLIKNPEEIELLRYGGRKLARILDIILQKIKPGISAAAIDQYAEKLIIEAGGQPSFKNYDGFPGTICFSPNDIVVHGVPNKEVIAKDGDIIGVDIGMRYPAKNGLYTDMARTIGVGKISALAKKLINVTEKSFFKGAKKIKDGAFLGDLGAAIQKYVESQGFSVVRDYCGHGVGHAVHEEPKVLNFGQAGAGEKLLAGMVIAIEPMVCFGHYEVITDRENWSVKTKDGSLAAHYENTLVITKDGYEILTK